MTRARTVGGRILLLGTGLVLLPAAVARSVEDQQEAAQATVVKTTDQLHFNLPPDWPVERRGGITAPIPVEEYLAMKFAALEGRLRALDQQFQGLEIRLRVMEESARSQQHALRSAEGGP